MDGAFALHLVDLGSTSNTSYGAMSLFGVTILLSIEPVVSTQYHWLWLQKKNPKILCNLRLFP